MPETPSIVPLSNGTTACTADTDLAPGRGAGTTCHAASSRDAVVSQGAVGRVHAATTHHALAGHCAATGYRRAVRRAAACLPLLLVAALGSGAAFADVWVLEPSLSLDQRFDDNYFLEPAGEGALSATRLVGELGLSRESQASAYRGLLRVDGLLTTSNEQGDEGLDSNQIAAFDATFLSERSRYGINFNFKQDTPSRDIAADVSDESSVASDTTLTVTQASNVSRQEFIITPRFEYDLSRRMVLDSKFSFSTVKHDLPRPQDAIYRQYIDTFPRKEDGSFDGTPKSYSDVTLDDVGGVIVPSGELDDFEEAEVDVGLRFKLSPIETVKGSIGYSRYTGEVEIDPYAIIRDEDFVSDPREPNIRRRPRRESISTTATLKIGYERSLSPTLRLDTEAGVYKNTTDTTDTLRPDDRPGEEIPQERLEPLDTENDGWLAAVSLTRDAGRTRYVGRFAVDVRPSSSGAQVETNELTGDIYHTLSPRLNFRFRARAYEPDRLGARREDRFARRFLSLEPKLTWQYSRAWSITGSYRYRRQKARIDPTTAESNAILLTLKYTPPSAIRDAANKSGL